MARPKPTGAFSELLNPVRDAESSFAINISELLDSYVRSFLDGSVNFNSAALMIQGSSSIYGKKVEYLHNLATKLYASLVKHKKDEGTKKETKEREKHTKESKFSDPFFSTDIKMGKNLSCLRKKFSAKNSASKKSSKKSDKKYTYTPVDLLPLEEEEKGMTLMDAKGIEIGKKNEFTLNKCKVMSSGWLLLPTVSPDLIPSESSSPDYSSMNGDLDDNMCNDSDDNMPESSPFDEGYPPSTGCSETPPSLPSSQGSTVPSSQGTDEGLGSLPCTPVESGSSQPSDNVSHSDTPMEDIQDCLNHGIEGIENIPLEDSGVAPAPRRSMRQALKVCQIQEDGAPNQPEENTPAAPVEKEVPVVKKAIQKKNTCNLPAKLKDSDTGVLNPASEFCARTFFSMDRNYVKKMSHSFEVHAFRNHGALYAKFRDIQAVLTRIKQKQKDKGKIVSAEENDEDDDEEIDADGVESNLDDPVANDDDIIISPLEADDIVIENNPAHLGSNPDFQLPDTDNDNALPNRISNNENPLDEDEPMAVEGLDDFSTFNVRELEDSFSNAAKQQCDLFRDDLQQYVQTSDISERVHAWEAIMKPYIAELDAREEFDIDLYGSRILNSFEDSNRKQTMTFRNFCKGKEKWEIHRYFMALLPLVNIGNVSIEPKEIDGGEDISVTLLSRKMHHKELEEFGHNEGEH